MEGGDGAGKQGKYGYDMGGGRLGIPFHIPINIIGVIIHGSMLVNPCEKDMGLEHDNVLAALLWM